MILVGEALKLTRQFTSLSEAELAKELNVTEEDIIQIESNTIRPSEALFEKYCRFFDTPQKNIEFLAKSLDEGEDAPWLSKKIIALMKWITSE